MLGCHQNRKRGKINDNYKVGLEHLPDFLLVGTRGGQDGRLPWAQWFIAVMRWPDPNPKGRGGGAVWYLCPGCWMTLLTALPTGFLMLLVNCTPSRVKSYTLSLYTL